SSHNYIQYLFPLPEPSPINPSAPIITETTFSAFRSRPELRSQLRRSLTRILQFYGLELIISKGGGGGGGPSSPNNDSKNENEDADGGDVDRSGGAGEVEEQSKAPPHYRVHPSPHFYTHASRNWVTRFNHNHLRITRILRCCRVLGLQDEAAAFYAALVDIAEGEKQQGGVISPRSLMFWRRAAERPLYLAPEDDDEDADVMGRGKEKHWLR
ncbi:MAG: hypothetical protein Q9216_007252, partial [Gyalolechia sp. 2 TL-2023]